jgi:hypothetical protein
MCLAAEKVLLYTASALIAPRICSRAFKVSVGKVTMRAASPETAPAARPCHTAGLLLLLLLSLSVRDIAMAFESHNHQMLRLYSESVDMTLLVRLSACECQC